MFEEKIVAAYVGGKTMLEVAKEYHISNRAVAKILRKNDVTIRTKGKTTENLTGNNYGSWTVLRRDETNHRDVQWWCQCAKCGELSSVTTSNLKCGASTKCRRCAYHNKAYKEIGLHYWHQLQTSARRRGYEFVVTKEELWQLYLDQKQVCAITGLPIILSVSRKLQTASLDRIDNSQGYVVGNVQWVHKNVNFMKWKLSQEEFIKICHMVANRFPGYNEK